MCSEPVTLGGGITMVKGSALGLRPGLKKPRASHSA